MFQGAAALSLDAKGRLAIPARHREALVSAAEMAGWC
jgi:MraZ protein